MRLQTLGSGMRRLLRDQRGASAVEFVIVSVPFLAIVFATLETAVVYYFSASLDRATNNVANQIRAGTLKLSTMSAATLNSAICGQLPAAMTCSSVQSNLQANSTCGVLDSCWSSYYSNWNNGRRTTPSLTSSSFSTGSANSALNLTVVYPMPLLSTLWSSVSTATVNGKLVRAVVSTAIFLRDPAVQP